MTPTKEGFFWGKWRIKDDDTHKCKHCGHQNKAELADPPGNEWEVMHVVENCIDTTDPEYLMVMVPGVEKWQSIENFFWGDEVRKV